MQKVQQRSSQYQNSGKEKRTQQKSQQAILFAPPQNDGQVSKRSNKRVNSSRYQNQVATHRPQENLLSSSQNVMSQLVPQSSKNYGQQHSIVLNQQNIIGPLINNFAMPVKTKESVITSSRQTTKRNESNISQRKYQSTSYVKPSKKRSSGGTTSFISSSQKPTSRESQKQRKQKDRDDQIYKSIVIGPTLENPLMNLLKETPSRN